MKDGFSTSIQSWPISLFIFFFSFMGAIISLICIYALPDKTVKFFEGGLFFIGGSLVLTALSALRWGKNTVAIDEFSKNKESPSDKLIKWLAVIYCFGFGSWGCDWSDMYRFTTRSKRPSNTMNCLSFCKCDCRGDAGTRYLETLEIETAPNHRRSKAAEKCSAPKYCGVALPIRRLV